MLVAARCSLLVQALADKKKAITDDDLMDLVTLDQEQQTGHGQWELGYIQVIKLFAYFACCIWTCY
jgi:hypothetical protein